MCSCRVSKLQRSEADFSFFRAQSIRDTVSASKIMFARLLPQLRRLPREQESSKMIGNREKVDREKPFLTVRKFKGLEMWAVRLFPIFLLCVRRRDIGLFDRELMAIRNSRSIQALEKAIGAMTYSLIVAQSHELKKSSAIKFLTLVDTDDGNARTKSA